MEMSINNAAPAGVKRKPGGQPGNQNARRHGFYSKVLDDDERRDYEEAKTCVGMEDEIALLRAKINSVLRHDGQNLKLLMIAMANLARLLKTHRQIAKNDDEGLDKAMCGVLNIATLPPGVKVVKHLDK